MGKSVVDIPRFRTLLRHHVYTWDRQQPAAELARELRRELGRDECSMHGTGQTAAVVLNCISALARWYEARAREPYPFVWTELVLNFSTALQEQIRIDGSLALCASLAAFSDAVYAARQALRRHRLLSAPTNTVETSGAAAALAEQLDRSPVPPPRRQRQRRVSEVNSAGADGPMVRWADEAGAGHALSRLSPQAEQWPRGRSIPSRGTSRPRCRPWSTCAHALDLASALNL